MRASMTELNVTATKRFNIGELFRKAIHGIGDMKNKLNYVTNKQICGQGRLRSGRRAA